MSQVVITNPQILINSVDLTNHIDSVTLDISSVAVEKTAFGDTGRKFAGGLREDKITLEFQQDFAVSSVDQTIFPLLNTVVPVIVKPVSGATSSINPAYTCDVLINAWKPSDGKIGDLLKASVQWPVSGVIGKATS